MLVPTGLHSAVPLVGATCSRWSIAHRLTTRQQLGAFCCVMHARMHARTQPSLAEGIQREADVWRKTPR